MQDLEIEVAGCLPPLQVPVLQSGGLGVRGWHNALKDVELLSPEELGFPELEALPPQASPANPGAHAKRWFKHPRAPRDGGTLADWYEKLRSLASQEAGAAGGAAAAASEPRDAGTPGSSRAGGGPQATSGEDHEPAGSQEGDEADATPGEGRGPAGSQEGDEPVATSNKGRGPAGSADDDEADATSGEDHEPAGSREGDEADATSSEGREPAGVRGKRHVDGDPQPPAPSGPHNAGRAGSSRHGRAPGRKAPGGRAARGRRLPAGGQGEQSRERSDGEAQSEGEEGAHSSDGEGTEALKCARQAAEEAGRTLAATKDALDAEASQLFFETENLPQGSQRPHS